MRRDRVQIFTFYFPPLVLFELECVYIQILILKDIAIWEKLYRVFKEHQGAPWECWREREGEYEAVEVGWGKSKKIVKCWAKEFGFYP